MYVIKQNLLSPYSGPGPLPGHGLEGKTDLLRKQKQYSMSIALTGHSCGTNASVSSSLFLDPGKVSLGK